MKTSNIQTTHNQAIIRGWVDPTALSNGNGGNGNVGLYQNSSGLALSAGAAVVLAADGTVTTTTTAQDTRPAGITLDAINDGSIGPIAWAGPVPLVAVTSAVTAGNYVETSTVAGVAEESATRRSGTFGYFTSSGTTPTAFLFGAGAGSSSGDGGMVPFEIQSGETFTVPTRKQALYNHAILVDGALVVDGILVFVS